MKRNVLLIGGALLIWLSAMIGLVTLPKYLVNEAEKSTMDSLYVPLEVRKGHQLYVREGCVYCHSQQVRPEGFGADVGRGWGKASLPEDYKGLTPHILGTMRTGPDLSNIGNRQPSRDWHYIHLYNPRAVVPQSIMPPYPWLFEVVDKQARPNTRGISLPPKYQIPDKKVIPTEEAEHLVDYLLSLNQKRSDE